MDKDIGDTTIDGLGCIQALHRDITVACIGVMLGRHGDCISALVFGERSLLFQALNGFGRGQDFSKREPEPSQSRFMLHLVRTPARVGD